MRGQIVKCKECGKKKPLRQLFSRECRTCKGYEQLGYTYLETTGTGTSVYIRPEDDTEARRWDR